MSEEEAKKGTSLLAIVLFGILTIIFAEVFFGSSPLWFLGIGGWLVTLPLYGAHALLFLNLAMRYERTSLTQLYLWGVVFGLFDGWITKVIWAGYMGGTPQFGTFLGFATGEFLIRTLFWHPVFSFIIPILVFQIIIQGTNKGEAGALHTSHLKVISSGIRNKILLGIIIAAGSLLMTMGLIWDSSATMVAAGISLAYILLLGYLTISLSKRSLDLESLRLGERSLSIIIIYLIALYAFTFFTLLPERIPALGTIILTIEFYMLVIGLIFISPRDTRKTIELPSGILNFGHLIWALVLFLMLAATWAMLSIVGLVLGTLFYLGMIFLGPVLFGLAVLWVIRKAIAGRQSSME